MLTLDPNSRITVEDALNHNYFKEEPAMCLKSEFPCIQEESHEYQTRKQKINICNNQAAGRQANPCTGQGISVRPQFISVDYNNSDAKQNQNQENVLLQHKRK